jgi:FG-GAP-like repeat
LIPVVASQPGAKLVAGKFNNDNRADLALVGGIGWSSIPVAFGNGNGTFTTTNFNNALFAAVSVQPGVKVVTGDFNGDGRTDIAATGAAGWTSIPVAFSNGDGSFATTNQFVWHFPGWAAQGSKVVAGDFDGDGRADLALTGVAGSITMSFAFSTGGGDFTAGSLPINNMPAWSAVAPFAVSGRFKPHTAGGDGRRDIALLGNSSWASVPMVSLRN